MHRRRIHQEGALASLMTSESLRPPSSLSPFCRCGARRKIRRKLKRIVMALMGRRGGQARARSELSPARATGWTATRTTKCNGGRMATGTGRTAAVRESSAKSARKRPLPAWRTDVDGDTDLVRVRPEEDGLEKNTWEGRRTCDR